MGQQSSRGKRVIAYSIISLILVLLALEIAGLILWVPGTWNARLTAVFAIVGIYGLAIGLLSENIALGSFKGALKDFTSPDVLTYLAGNTAILGLLFGLYSHLLSAYRVKGYRVALFYLGMFLYTVWVPIFIAYTVFHIFIVMVLSYIPVVLASAMVAPIFNSSSDVENSAGQKKGSVSSIVKKDPVATKGFLIGLPAIFISLLSAISAPFISG